MEKKKITVLITDKDGSVLLEYSEPVEISRGAMENITWIKKGVWTIKELLNINISKELDRAREEGRKEKDIASDFLYWHPLGGGMPDSSIRIGVEFEVGGCYEDWGFVIEQNGRTISSGRTLKEAISKLTTK